ncbi:DUF4352 domain-containing protein [Actinomadura parmotrematis]|uniref:DUF4352 domain-containing protein n=1 Tax=Actinomadura parmotrematis TaxID=2864039 RepID=A0ABS7FYK8_9ACTN|nr:DUF4352 domain-containing protein [Actinomadura parmotrematis]MBW8485526.1 DUF4352 domain-containing protein [Actinomadura parmotrematis]
MPNPPPAKGNALLKGCLIAVAGVVGLMVLLVACGALIGSSGEDTAAKKPAAQQPGATHRQSHEAAPKTPASRSTAPRTPANGIGREYRDGKFAFTVTKVKKGVRRVGDQYFGRTAQGQYVLLYVRVENIGDDARSFSDGNQDLFDTKDRKFSAGTEAQIALGDQAKAFLEDVNPGNTVNGVLIYDVPKGVKLHAVELHDSMFSGGVTVPLGDR